MHSPFQKTGSSLSHPVFCPRFVAMFNAVLFYVVFYFAYTVFYDFYTVSDVFNTVPDVIYTVFDRGSNEPEPPLRRFLFRVRG